MLCLHTCNFSNSAQSIPKLQCFSWIQGGANPLAKALCTRQIPVFNGRSLGTFWTLPDLLTNSPAFYCLLCLEARDFPQRQRHRWCLVRDLCSWCWAWRGLMYETAACPDSAVPHLANNFQAPKLSLLLSMALQFLAVAQASLLQWLQLWVADGLALQQLWPAYAILLWLPTSQIWLVTLPRSTRWLGSWSLRLSTRSFGFFDVGTYSWLHSHRPQFWILWASADSGEQPDKYHSQRRWVVG